MEQTHIDTRQNSMGLNKRYRKKTWKRMKIGLFCFLLFISGFLLGTYFKAEAALYKSLKSTAYIEDQRIKEKILMLGPLESTEATDSSSSTLDDNGGVSNNAQTEPSNEGTEEWTLILVNSWNKVPAGYDVTLKQLKNGHAVDERCYPDLQQMMDDCRASELSPVICSSYRSMETQVRLFNNKVTYYTNLGYSLKNAETEAAKVIAVPGTSEHQLGLAVDIVDVNNQNLDSSQEKTAVQQWLIENSWKYGFILRYPSDKGDITGIIYEPWHYRYVGKKAAAEIYDQGICLEEYLS